MQINVSVKITDDNGKPLFGNGVLWLLENIEKTGSISSAARNMNMSYSKACNIIKNFEKSANLKLLIRHKGGSEKGGAELTDTAKKIMNKYLKIRKSIVNYAETLNF
jgi:molybdate transport system regulatory protein